jgi:hypothetical protein
MYSAIGSIMGALVGCAVMALYPVGGLLGFVGALAGGALGAGLDALVERQTAGVHHE